MGWVPLMSSQFKTLTFDVWSNRFKASCDWFRYSKVERVFETQEFEIQKLLLRGSPVGFCGIRDLPHLKLGIWGFKAKSGRDSGLKYAREVGCLKYSSGLRECTNIWVGITGLNLGIRDSRAKSSRDSGLKVCAGGRMPKITLGIRGLRIPYGDPLTLKAATGYTGSRFKSLYL